MLCPAAGKSGHEYHAKHHRVPQARQVAYESCRLAGAHASCSAAECKLLTRSCLAVRLADLKPREEPAQHEKQAADEVADDVEENIPSKFGTLTHACTEQAATSAHCTWIS